MGAARWQRSLGLKEQAVAMLVKSQSLKGLWQ
jgi:hypothetical protein